MVEYKVVDYEEREVFEINFHGSSLEIFEVYENGVICLFPEDSIVFIGIDELKEHNKSIAKIVKKGGDDS